MPTFWPPDANTSTEEYTSFVADITSIFTLAGVNPSRKCIPEGRYTNLMTVVNCAAMPCKYNYSDENEIRVISSLTYHIYASAECAICNGESLKSLHPIYRSYDNCTDRASTVSYATLYKHGLEALKSLLLSTCMFYPVTHKVLQNVLLRQTCITGLVTDVEPVKEISHLNILCKHMQSYHYAHGKYYKNPFCILQRPDDCNKYQYDNKSVEAYKNNALWHLVMAAFLCL